MNRWGTGAGLRIAGRVVVGLVLAGCASAPSRVPVVQVRAEPVAATPAAAAGALPELPVTQVAALGGARRISLDVADVDVRDVIRQIADSFGLGMEVSPEVSGRVTARLHNATLQDALDATTATQGLAYSVQGQVLRVTRARMETRIFEVGYLALSRTSFGSTQLQRSLGGGGAGGGAGGAGGGGGGGGGGGAGGAGGSSSFITTTESSNLWEETRVSLLSLVFGTDEVATVAGGAGAAGGGAAGAGAGGGPAALSRVGEDGRRVIINPMAGTVMVTAPPAVLADVEVFLRTFEASVQRQVLIEAKIVEVTLNRRYQFGIDWDAVRRLGRVGLNLATSAQTGGATLAFSAPGGADNAIDLVLDALESQGEVRVMSSPHISVMNNQRAVFNVSTDEVFFEITREPILGPNGGTIGFNTEVNPQQVAVGISLDVMAQIASDNTITMSVRPSVTNVVRTQSVNIPDGPSISAPVIDRRESDTVVRTRGGETIVIGGLMQTVQRDQVTGIPLLRDIPLVGALFRGTTQETEKRELVLFLTPRVVTGQPPLAR